MTSFRPPRPSGALVVSVIALIVALGGTSYAAFSLPAHSIGSEQLKTAAVGTQKLKKGAVTAAKINVKGLTVPNALHAKHSDTATAAAHATTATHAASATHAGHATSAGHALSATHAGHATIALNSSRLGGRGAAAYQSKVVWARVAPDGTLSDGRGVLWTNHPNIGVYEVRFNRNVSDCAYVATVGSSLISNTEFDSKGPAFIRTLPLLNDSHGVTVAINGTNLGGMDNSFHLAVVC
ncbi:MAG: hypothetical protein ACJ764_00610 [Solirubrobacteraceae bacterium]